MNKNADILARMVITVVMFLLLMHVLKGNSEKGRLQRRITALEERVEALVYRCDEHETILIDLTNEEE